MKISPLTSFTSSISRTNILTSQSTTASQNSVSTDNSTQKSHPSGRGGPPPEIQAQLDKYGLSATGSIEGELSSYCSR